jgi:hypothetical protein
LAQDNIWYVLMGRGFNSVSDAYASGLLQDDGLEVPDNQIVTALVTTGVFGVVAILMLFANAIIRGNRSFRASMVIWLVMFFSFDALLWPVATLLLIVGWLAPDFAETSVGRIDDRMDQSGFPKEVQ